MNIGAKLNKKIRFLIVLISCTGAFLLMFYGALEVTGRPQVCSQCHMMKPEFYTWQASSHKKIECGSCHVPPGLVNFFKYRLSGLKELYYMATASYAAPIVILKPVTDDACNRCHNMATRHLSPSGDLIIPHDVHARKKVSCSKCHGGVAHGNIAKRKVTYSVDYGKWNSELGTSLMGEQKYIRPDMDLCINCHKALKAPLACRACHKTSMLPDNHKNDEFKYENHGRMAARDLNYCDSCHSYMTDKKIEVVKETKNYQDYLGRGKNRPTVTVKDYSRQNTYCKTCHSKRPPSHRSSSFTAGHGKQAGVDRKRCMTCHDNYVPQGPGGPQGTDETLVTGTACSSCHPSPHSKSVQWQNGYHPVELPARPRINASCYTCHNKESCGACHRS